MPLNRRTQNHALKNLFEQRPSSTSANTPKPVPWRGNWQVAPRRSRCRSWQGKREKPPPPPSSSLSSPGPGHLIFSSRLSITWSFPLATSRTLFVLSFAFLFLLLRSTPFKTPPPPPPHLSLFFSFRRSSLSPSPPPHPMFLLLFVFPSFCSLRPLGHSLPRHYPHYQRHHQHPVNR